MFYPDHVELISRRIEVDNTADLLARRTKETLVIHNKGKNTEPEFAIELEHFRQELQIYDSTGSSLVFLPNSLIKSKLASSALKKKLDQNELLLAWIKLPDDNPLQPDEYRQIILKYVEHPDESASPRNLIENLFSISRILYYPSDVIFSDKETMSMFVNYESGISHWLPLIIMPLDTDGNAIEEFDPWKTTHYQGTPHHESFSISYKKRTEFHVDTLHTAYFVIPEIRLRITISALVLFAIIFPTIVSISYATDNNLSFFGVGITSELILLFTLGINRLQTKLLSIDKYIGFLLVETALILIVGALFPHESLKFWEDFWSCLMQVKRFIFNLFAVFYGL